MLKLVRVALPSKNSKSAVTPKEGVREARAPFPTAVQLVSRMLSLPRSPILPPSLPLSLSLPLSHPLSAPECAREQWREQGDAGAG